MNLKKYIKNNPQAVSINQKPTKKLRLHQPPKD